MNTFREFTFFNYEDEVIIKILIEHYTVNYDRSAEIVTSTRHPSDLLLEEDGRGVYKRRRVEKERIRP